MLRSFAIVAAAAMLFGASAADAAACKDAKGKFTACPAPATAVAKASTANTLDAKGNCHAPDGKMVKKSMCAAPATAATATGGPVGAMASSGGPNCKTGKRCGNACISKADTCHK